MTATEIYGRWCVGDCARLPFPHVMRLGTYSTKWIQSTLSWQADRCTNTDIDPLDSQYFTGRIWLQFRSWDKSKNVWLWEIITIHVVPLGTPLCEDFIPRQAVVLTGGSCECPTLLRRAAATQPVAWWFLKPGSTLGIVLPLWWVHARVAFYKMR